MDIPRNNQVFRPLDKEGRLAIANRFKLTNYLIEVPDIIGEGYDLPTNHRSSTTELVLRNSLGDGNCWYRSFSYTILGTEDAHLEFRAIMYASLLKLKQNFYNAGPAWQVEYDSRIPQAGQPYVWATNEDMLALATALDVTIVNCYYDTKGDIKHFPFYPMKDLRGPFNPEEHYKYTPAIYIANTGMRSIVPKEHTNHFRSILGVRRKNMEPNTRLVTAPGPSTHNYIPGFNPDWLKMQSSKKVSPKKNTKELEASFTT